MTERPTGVRARLLASLATDGARMDGWMDRTRA